jgi:hypothetical protein
MLDGNLCELCTNIVTGSKARHKQTKYCNRCAKLKKRRNTIESCPSEDRREYMKEYMREYRRKHPGLSTRYVQKLRVKRKPKIIKAA